MKKVIALILCLMLILCACAPASSDNKQTANETQQAENTGVESTNEPVKLRIAVLTHANDTINAENFGTKYAYAKATEELGYEIEWIVIPEGEGAKERLAIMLADDLPDVFWGPFINQESLLIQNRELFVPLNDKLEESCPNLYATMEANFDGWEQYLTHDDGNIYSLPGYFMQNYNNQVQGVAWINQKWLTNLGLEMPTTMEELEAVLAAFRDQDANGNGNANDEIPMDYCQSYWSAKIEEIAHMFGITMNSRKFFDIVDGKVTSVIDTDTYREFLEHLHYWSKEGLANIEGTTQTSEMYNSNIANGRVGVFFGWTPATFIADPELAGQYVALNPISAEGHTFRVMPNGLSCARPSYVVTTACENVDAALALYDYFCASDKIALESQLGPEGLMWEMVDGVPYYRAYTAEEAKSFGYGDDIAALAGTSSFKASMGLVNNSALIITSPRAVEGTADAVRESGVNLYEPYFTDEIMSKGIVPADVQEEFEFATDGLDKYIYAYSSAAIVNGVTDENWNEYVSGLARYGMDAHIEYYQNYYDGTF